MENTPGAGQRRREKISGGSAFRGAVVTSVWTLLSRILGFARDAAMLAVFGASVATGNFVIAWMLPNLFRRLFGEGAVSAAIQPALARAQEEEGQEAAARLFAAFMGVFALLLTALVVVGEVVLLTMLNSLEPGDADEEALKLSVYLLPYVLPICMTALAGAPQQLSGRFSLPALAPAALNTVWISWLVVIGEGADILLLPIGVLIGGMVQWTMQFPGLRADGWPLLPRFDFANPRLREALKAFAPAVIGLAAVQLNLLVDQILVREMVSEEANSFTYASSRLIQLPGALVGVAAATGAMPLFARLAAEQRKNELTQTLQKSSEMTLMLMIAAGFGMGVLAEPIIRVLFEHGRFTATDTELLTPVLRAYLWSLPASAMLGLTVRVRQASGDLRGPARIAIGMVPINLGLNLLLLPMFGVAGAGYATSITITLQYFRIAQGLPKIGVGPPIRGRRLLTLLAPGAASTLAAGLVYPNTADVLPEWVALTLGILAGVAAAGLVAWKFLPEEAAQLLAKLNRKR